MAPNLEVKSALYEQRPVTAGGLVNSRDSSLSPNHRETTKKEISHLSKEAPKVKLIRDAIRNEDKRLREKYFLLSHEMQDAMGLLVYVGAFALWYSFSWAWMQGLISFPVLVVLNALAISLLHEMEHDLIHELYFKAAPWVQHVMFMGIWLIKSNAAPWWRKYYHLKHHMESGQTTDVEERLIGLGLPAWHPKRILVTLTPAATLLVARDVARDDPEFSIMGLIAANGPVIAPASFSMIFEGLAFAGLADWMQASYPAVGAVYTSLLPYMHMYNCAVNLPNSLRQMCLVIISTYCHYYGDIPEKDVWFQTQILDHWTLWPLQFFCFNFGATHIIHHFVTRQPFYLRQVTAYKILPIMKEQGCRHNDFGNQLRANRWEGFKKQ